MARHQSNKQRLSEDTVKQTLEKFDRRKLIGHLSCVALDGDVVDHLVSIMRKGGLPLIKHPNPTMEAKRASCISAIENHIEIKLGNGEADKVRAFMALVARIEQGYQKILKASMASARLDLETTLSALLEAGTRQAVAHHKDLMAVLHKTGTFDGNGLSLPGAGEGDRIDPEVPLDSVIDSVTMSLLMQGHRFGLFNADGVLVMPPPVIVDDTKVEAVHSILYLAQCWRFWEHLEEDTRYFGGDIEQLDPSEIPLNWREKGVVEVWHHAPLLRIPRKMGTDSTRSWALIPRHRGQPFQTSGRLADRFMESGLSRWVKRF